MLLIVDEDDGDAEDVSGKAELLAVRQVGPEVLADGGQEHWPGLCTTQPLHVNIPVVRVQPVYSCH